MTYRVYIARAGTHRDSPDWTLLGTCLPTPEGASTNVLDVEQPYRVAVTRGSDYLASTRFGGVDPRQTNFNVTLWTRFVKLELGPYRKLTARDTTTPWSLKILDEDTQDPNAILLQNVSLWEDATEVAGPRAKRSGTIRWNATLGDEDAILVEGEVLWGYDPRPARPIPVAIPRVGYQETLFLSVRYWTRDGASVMSGIGIGNYGSGLTVTAETYLVDPTPAVLPVPAEPEPA